MDIREIQNLIKFVAKSGATEVKLEMGDIKITIKTTNESSSPEVTYIQQAPAAQALPQAAPAAQAVTPAAPVVADENVSVLVVLTTCNTLPAGNAALGIPVNPVPAPLNDAAVIVLLACIVPVLQPIQTAFSP